MAVLFTIYGIRSHWKFTKKIVMAGVVLSIYFAIVVGLTLLNRTPSEHHRTILKFFWSYGVWIKGSKQAPWEIIGNILMLVPYGMILPIFSCKLRRFRWMFAASFSFTLLIEVSQYITCRGWFELDDLIHNTIGGLIGFRLFQMLKNE